jgi:VanZ family protein
MKPIFRMFPMISLILVILTIGILSLLPPESGFELKKDKLGHFLAYLALSVNAMYFVVGWRHLVITVILVLGYGGVLEILQGFVPGRDSSILDMVANSYGAFVGIGIHLLVGKRLKKFLNS